MKVARDFETIYARDPDPWSIGDADSQRYNTYCELIKAHSQSRKAVLDVGCGFGAFLSRFRGEFQQLIGVELSRNAIRKGQERFPFIQFVHGSAERLQTSIGEKNRFGCIIFSDVIYYLDEKGKASALKWIADHLEPDGLAFVAAWCPAGNYLACNELRRLVQRFLVIQEEHLLDSQHAIFLARRKRSAIAITLDYETWHPIPPGCSINWEEDIFNPTEQFLQICDQENVKLTLLAEMAEYFWLREHDPAIAERMEQQWRDAVRRGHDVQLHLHPCWLPELGACCDGGNWTWDWTKAKAHDYPGDLTSLVSRCKSALETILRDVEPTYQVNAFRAGAYQAQPFKRLYGALAANGILCDSSVHEGGVSLERGYDYRLAYSSHQPYFANACDPQLKAPPSERAIIEIPVFTCRPGQRWSLDGEDGGRVADRLMHFVGETGRHSRTTEAHRRREVLKKLLQRLYYPLASAGRYLDSRLSSHVVPAITGEAYRRQRRIARCVSGLVWRLLQGRRKLAALLMRRIGHFLALYPSESQVDHEYFVMIGHTKGWHDFPAIAANLGRLKQDGRFDFVTLSEMAIMARDELLPKVRKSAREESLYQVEREYRAIMGEARNAAQSYRLQEMIPLDVKSVLDLGCGAGYWTARVAELYPWMTVAGVDCGVDFIAKARGRYPGDRVTFQVADFADLPYRTGALDCVYADNTLEHAFDVDRTLAEVYRVLRWGGVLVAAIPSDARNPKRICDDHTWKTAPHEIRMRLSDAGFVNIEVLEVDTFAELGMPAYPPSNDRMMYIKAWKRSAEASRLERALLAMEWLYRNVSPDEPHTSEASADILMAGRAWCGGYAAVMQSILEREGFTTRRVSFFMKGHPRGRGEEWIESHSLIEVELQGKWELFDPTCNIYFDGHSIEELIERPALAAEVLRRRKPDSRFEERQYDLYCGESAFTRCFRVKRERTVAPPGVRRA